MSDAWDWILGRKRLNNHRKRSNGHFKKEFVRHYPAIFLLSIAVLSVGMTGYYLGVNSGEPMSGYTPPIEKTPPYVTEAIEIDTVDTEITNSTKVDDGMIFEFEGRGINQTTVVAGYECRLNLDEAFQCISPYKTKELGEEESFEVAAVDSNGNVDHTPAIWMQWVK